MRQVFELIRIASAARSKEISSTEIQEIKNILTWQQEILNQAINDELPIDTTVQKIIDYFSCSRGNAIGRMYADQMLGELKDMLSLCGIHDPVFTKIDEWLISINYVIQRAPDYTPDKDKQVFFPMSKLFVFFMFTPSGAILFRDTEFTNNITAILQTWCDYLDSAASRAVLNPTQQTPAPTGWLSQAAQKQFCLSQSVNFQYEDDPEQPYWDFASYNDFFHRAIKLDELRPLAGPDDDQVIVSANDGTVYRIARDVQPCAKFWLKGQNYALENMFDHSPLAEHFFEGDVLQSFLDGSDYHRWHAPISGKVVEARVISGLTFSELLSEGLDLSAGTRSQGYEATVNTRGLIIIENEEIGRVAMLPIGITEISSVNIQVKVGDVVNKGQELGYFSYGGSSMALVFEKGMIAEFTAKEPSENITVPACKCEADCQPDKGCLLVRGQIAIANLKE